jgi:hypothetical protein
MDPSVDSIGQNHPAFRPENGSGLAALGQKAAAVVQRIRRWRSSFCFGTVWLR